MKSSYLFLLFGLVLLGSCQRSVYVEDHRPTLTRINIVDREGFATTIHAPDRLKFYQNTNFLTPQAYEKVMGIYERDSKGIIRSFITSYYENGQVRRYLDVVNGRAHGIYHEWHENGVLKLEAYIMGGEADLTDEAMRSWLFDGRCRAWNTQGQLEAQFDYDKGKLEGESLEYHANGAIKRRVAFHENALDGCETFYDDQGLLLERNHYAMGLRQGRTERYWSNGALMAEEQFERDCLFSGRYYAKDGKEIAMIKEGAGFRAIFDQQRCRRKEQYQSGLPKGLVELFDENGSLMQSYYQKEGKKNGEERFYYAPTSMQEFLSGQVRPKISLMWVDDELQGIVRTWYENGQIESQREIHQNARNGVCSAWYRNGHVMLMEEYEQDKLMKGEYYRKTDRYPVSIVHDGEGIATLYDADGTFIRKIEYFRSSPISE